MAIEDAGESKAEGSILAQYLKDCRRDETYRGNPVVDNLYHEADVASIESE